MTTTVQLAAPAAAEPPSRLTPALVGTWSRNQIVYIPCPSWCTEDHAAEPYALEDITHYTDMAGVQVSTFLDEDTALYNWWARIESDPASNDPRMQAAHVMVGDDSVNEARMTPDMAEAFADDLIKFASQVRSAAYTARTFTEAKGGAQ